MLLVKQNRRLRYTDHFESCVQWSVNGVGTRYKRRILVYVTDSHKDLGFPFPGCEDNKTGARPYRGSYRHSSIQKVSTLKLKVEGRTSLHHVCYLYRVWESPVGPIP